MVFILFGLIWTLFTAVFTWGFYFSGGDITVNGELLTQAEFNALLWPKIFVGIFWIIGIVFLIGGIKYITRNKKTDIKGEECFGKLIKLYHSGTYINDMPELKADFAMYIPSEDKVKIMSEVVGINENDFPIGEYFILKYYDGDINVFSRFDEDGIPLNILDIINSEYNKKINDSTVIEINGEKYMKIE